MLCDDLGGEMGKGREAKEGSDIYVCVCVYVRTEGERSV